MSRKIFSVLLCICLLLCTVSFSEERDPDSFSTEITDEMREPETTEDDSILLKVWNLSYLNISYLRFDYYVGDEYRSMTASCPNEGEDFYCSPYTPEDPEELKDLRIECSYGISDLSPEDAILQLMMGNPAEEFPVDLEDLSGCCFECGKVYHFALAGGSEYAALIAITDHETE